MEEVTKAAKLIGVDPDFFVDTFMKPKLKVITVEPAWNALA